jgi:transposase-like protein
MKEITIRQTSAKEKERGWKCAECKTEKAQFAILFTDDSRFLCDSCLMKFGVEIATVYNKKLYDHAPKLLIDELKP